MSNINDNGNKIRILFRSSVYPVYENNTSKERYILGYISGEFEKLITNSDLFIRVYYKRGVALDWEKIEFKLNKGQLIFQQKLPAGLLVSNFYIELDGYIEPIVQSDEQLLSDFILTSLRLSIKRIPIGRYGNEIITNKERLGIKTFNILNNPSVVFDIKSKITSEINNLLLTTEYNLFGMPVLTPNNNLQNTILSNLLTKTTSSLQLTIATAYSLMKDPLATSVNLSPNNISSSILPKEEDDIQLTIITEYDYLITG